MKELLKRVLTALILIPIVFGIFYISGIPLLLFIMLFLAGGMLEYLNLYRLQNYISIILLIILMLAFYYLNLDNFIYFSTLLLFLYTTFYLARWQREYSYSFEKFAGELFVFLYLLIGGIFIFLIRQNLGFKYIILFFLSVWTYDTGAFLFGKMLGRHKLAYKISPNKTIEGAIFGFLTLFIGMLIYSFLRWNDFQLTFLDILLFAMLVSFTATLGDLVESVWKREQGKKDSSHLFPGHGGVLDRIDSLVLTAPFFYLFFKLLF